jgi:hypothetical protein
MMSSVHHWDARSQLKLYLFLDKSRYPSKCFTRLGPIEVEREEVCLVEMILDDRKKNQRYQILVH